MRSNRTLPIASWTVLLVLVAAPVVAGEGVTAESLFEQAETLYRQLDVVDPSCSDPASWASLAEVFAAIPERYPSHPLAGQALWRLGGIRACAAAGGDLAASHQALVAYQLLASRYPTSPYAARALLQVGELSGATERQTAYYRILQRYPGSSEAEEARRRLRGAAAPSVGEGSPQRAAADSPVQESSSPVPQAPAGEVLEASPTPASRTSPPAARPSPGPGLGSVLGVRTYADTQHTRVVFDLDRPVPHEIGEAQSPPRVFVDLLGASLPPDLQRDLSVAGSGVERVRIGVNRPGVVRVVLDLTGPSSYTFFTLTEPARLVVDVASPELSERLANARRPPEPAGGAEARQLSLAIRRVVIDPGHGGQAPGAIGRSGITEKELTLDIARRLAENLKRSGYDARLTRDGDATLALEERPEMATSQGADLFVSVHVNSSTNRKLSGFETYYLDLATDPTAAETAARENASSSTGIGHLDEVLDEIVKNANKRESRDLAHSIQDSLVLQLTKEHDDIRDLGVKHAPFLVLVGAQMPAVLVECSFLSHPEEEERLRDAVYRQKVADAIHIGIENFAARRRMISSTH